MSKLYRNIIFNFVGQFYLSTIMIIMAPVYIRYMGLEAYGLIGFFTLTQSWIQIFDLGFSATLSRQSAQYCSGTLSAFEFRSVFKSIQILFCFLTFILFCFAYYIGNEFSNFWIKANDLSQIDIKTSVIFIFFVSILRWQGGLYRGIVNGFEQQVWLNKFNITFSSFKYLVVLIYLNYYSQSIVDFFYYQFIINFLELFFLWRYVHKSMPKISEKVIFKYEYIKKNLYFSLSVAFSSLIWVAVTQLDKLILSKLLTLKNFACYTMAVTLASGINIIISPLSSAILPRFSALMSQNKQYEFQVLYKNVTKLIVMMVMPVMLMMVIQGDKILYAWSNNHYIVENSYKILRGYAIGNVILAVLGMSYYLQFATGKLRLHLIGNIIFVIVLVPMLIYATFRWGGIGASYVWIICNLLYLLFWTPIVHMRYMKYSYLSWITDDILKVSIISGFFSIFLIKFCFVLSGRLFIVFESGFVFIVSVILTSLVIFPEFRNFLLKKDFIIWLNQKFQFVS